MSEFFGEEKKILRKLSRNNKIVFLPFITISFLILAIIFDSRNRILITGATWAYCVGIVCAFGAMLTLLISWCLLASKRDYLNKHAGKKDHYIYAPALFGYLSLIVGFFFLDFNAFIQIFDHDRWEYMLKALRPFIIVMPFFYCLGYYSRANYDFSDSARTTVVYIICSSILAVVYILDISIFGFCWTSLFETIAILLYFIAYGALFLNVNINANIETAPSKPTNRHTDIQLEYLRRIDRQTSSINRSVTTISRDSAKEFEQITDIQNQVTQINSRTAKMEQQLDSLAMFVKTDLKTVLTYEKKKLQGRACKDDDFAVSCFVKEASEYINTKTQSADDLVMQEEAHLKSLFGAHWFKLIESSRTSLISAGVLWKSCAGISRTDFDFSGVCISAAAALETELKRVFFTGFQKFMQEKYGVPDANCWETTFQKWPEKLLSISKSDFEAYCEMHSSNPKSKRLPKLETSDMFTMGLLPYIFGQPEQERNIEQENLLRKRLSEYLATIVLEKYKENPIAAFYKAGKNTSFVGKCESIRRNYRNKAAHTDVVSRDQAANCYQQVIGKIDAFEYSSDITGLLIELFDKLKDI